MGRTTECVLHGNNLQTGGVEFQGDVEAMVKDVVGVRNPMDLQAKTSGRGDVYQRDWCYQGHGVEAVSARRCRWPKSALDWTPG